VQIPPGTETCGCCAGVDASTPQTIDNRMGLSAIAYRIGEYQQFKDSMIAGLSASEFGLREQLRTREDNDFTIGLIDAVACAADVLTFYQERIANESYLRTATERLSLQEMARLIGYRLRPGVAAETWLAFALEPPKTPPPGLPPDPGAFVTGIPTSLTLPAGLKVQSVPGPDEKPQTFETVEEITARPRVECDQAVAVRDALPGIRRHRGLPCGGREQSEAGRCARVRGPGVSQQPDHEQQLGLPNHRHGRTRHGCEPNPCDLEARPRLCHAVLESAVSATGPRAPEARGCVRPQRAVVAQHESRVPG
jgi:hypothetical protein